MLKEKLVIERKAATLITVDFTAPEIGGICYGVAEAV